MTDTTTYEQTNMVGAGEVMEVVMTGGDGGAMTEDTLTQVVNMLQMEGQLSNGGNHTIIIRQPGSDDVQMIQATSNEGELIVSKASAADIQALQNSRSLSMTQAILENQQEQVMMVDETGNLVEGVVQLPTSDGQEITHEAVQQLQQMTSSDVLNGAVINGQNTKSQDEDILNSLVSAGDISSQDMASVSQQSILMSTPASGTPIRVTTSMSSMPDKSLDISKDNAVSIKIDTGIDKKRDSRKSSHPGAIVISTVTGQQKYLAPKFHKCEACVINFVSKIAYLNHMESCPNRRKPVTKNNITYTCVFCETKFATRVSLMQHVRTCDKAKSTKNISNKIKPGGDAKLRVNPKQPRIIGDSLKKPKKIDIRGRIDKSNIIKRNKVIFNPDDDIDDLLEERDMDSDEEDEKNIEYDDDEDLNDEMMGMDDVNVDESLVNRQSQKHLGPTFVKGMFKCRDCARTFSKETQYNRHVNACTMAPLGIAKNESDAKDIKIVSESGLSTEMRMFGMKRKRGRVSLPDEKHSKRHNPGPKIVSVDPKKVVAASLKGKAVKIYDQGSDDDESKDKLLFTRPNKSSFQKSSKISGGPISKIVKISPSDSLVTKAGKTLISKIGQTKPIKVWPYCGLCGDKFKSSEELHVHTKLTHSEDILALRDSLEGKGAICSIKCPLCNSHFTQSHHLVYHLVACHTENLQEVQKELESINLNLSCPFCETVQLSQSLLKEHLARDHLDKLANVPTTLVSPVAIDVNSLLKESHQVSDVVDTQHLINAQRIKCPDCSLFVMARFYQHHKCGSQATAASDKVFLCNQLECTDVAFAKLSQLLIHFIQVHESTLASQRESFDTLTSFLEWLKLEEIQIKKKYTQSLQRIVNGKLATVWTCHHFHNSMTDKTKTPVKQETQLDRLNMCYSRIHSITSFNQQSSRYDGETEIKYYPEHIHMSNNPVKLADEQKTPADPIQNSEEVSQKSTEDEAGTVDTDLEATKEQSLNSSPSEFPKLDLDSSSPPEEDDGILSEMKDLEQDFAETPGSSVSADMAKAEEETVASSKDEANMVNLTDTDLLLEKIMGEHLADEQSSANDTELASTSTQDTLQSSEPDLCENISKPTQEHMVSLIPSESKISDEDMLQAFGVGSSAAELADCIQSEENSNSTCSNSQVNSTSAESQPSPAALSDCLQTPEHKEQDHEQHGDVDVEENTYVLPADLEEWKKLFELVRAQIDSNSLSTDALLEAQSLLPFEDQISTIPIEKQVDVFARLCTLANVSMT